MITSQATKRLLILSVLSKQGIEVTIQNMVEGLETLGPVRPTSTLNFNIGGTDARQAFMITTTTRAVSNYFISKGFRHISAGMLKKSEGDSVATVQLTLAGGLGVALILNVYSTRS
jgi:hypothetical protein